MTFIERATWYSICKWVASLSIGIKLATLVLTVWAIRALGFTEIGQFSSWMFAKIGMEASFVVSTLALGGLLIGYLYTLRYCQRKQSRFPDLVVIIEGFLLPVILLLALGDLEHDIVVVVVRLGLIS